MRNSKALERLVIYWSSALLLPCGDEQGWNLRYTEVISAGLKRTLCFAQQGTLNFQPQLLRPPKRCKQQDGCWQLLWCSCLNWYPFRLRCNFQSGRQLGLFEFKSRCCEVYNVKVRGGKELGCCSIFKLLKSLSHILYDQLSLHLHSLLYEA